MELRWLILETEQFLFNSIVYCSKVVKKRIISFFKPIITEACKKASGVIQKKQMSWKGIYQHFLLNLYMFSFYRYLKNNGICLRE